MTLQAMEKTAEGLTPSAVVLDIAPAPDCSVGGHDGVIMSLKSASRLHVIFATLENLIALNSAKDPLKNITRLHGRSITGISFDDYFLRLVRYLNCSESCYICALIYIDRYMEMNPDFVISYYSIYRLFAAAMLVSMKYLEDTYFTNEYYARVFGVETAELNCIEVDFFLLVKGRLFIDEQLYKFYINSIDIKAPRLVLPEKWASLSDIGIIG